MPLPVVGDDPVGRLEDVSRGPVVLFEADYPCAGVELVEVEDVFNIGSTPPVNRLVVIADDRQVPLLAGEHRHQPELDSVRVLVLVNHNPLVPGTICLEDIRRLLPEPDCEAEQVVEVKQVHLP